MIGSCELREKMKTCLSNDIEVFTTKGLKEWLKEQGCTYNVDYEVNAFSNAITYLIKNIIFFLQEKKENIKW